MKYILYREIEGEVIPYVVTNDRGIDTLFWKWTKKLWQTDKKDKKRIAQRIEEYNKPDDIIEEFSKRGYKLKNTLEDGSLYFVNNKFEGKYLKYKYQDKHLEYQTNCDTIRRMLHDAMRTCNGVTDSYVNGRKQLYGGGYIEPLDLFDKLEKMGFTNKFPEPDGSTLYFGW